MRAPRDGFIVVAVLAVLALLTSLLGSLSLAARGGIDAALTASEQLRLEALTRAGADLVVHELYGLRRPAHRVDGREIRLDDGTVAVRVEDEAGKVDLNGSDPILLAGIYRAAGLGGLEPERFAAQVVAWRDRLPAPAGAGAPREPGFRTVGELRWLPGMTAEDAAVLADLVTVHNPGGKILPASAPETVLRALPGVSPQTLERVLRLRESPTPRMAEGLAALLRGQQAYLASRAGRSFRIRLDATTAARSHARIRFTTVKAAAGEALAYTTTYESLF